MSQFGGQQGPLRPADIQIDINKVIRHLIAAIVILFVIIGVFTSYFTVEPEGKAVVKRFGEVIGVKEPGLHFKLPFGIDRQYFVPTERVLKEEFGFRTTQARQRTVFDKSTQYVQSYGIKYKVGEEIKESLMLTGDLNVLDVQWVVQYRINDPDKYLHRLRNQIETIRVISESVMRRIVGNRLWNHVISRDREYIAQLSKDELQRILDSYEMGVRITTIEMKDVTPPDEVKPAFYDINQARQQREQTINEAQKQYNQQIPRLRGEALKIVSQAEGDAAERVNRSMGASERFKAVYAEYKQAPDITRQRMYLEMVDEILPNIGKVYVTDGDGVSPIPLLHLDEATPTAKRMR